MRRCSSSRRRLADQQALHLDGQHDGDDDEQQADGDRADGVPARLAGERGRGARPTGRSTRPIGAPTSSSSTTGSSGAFEPRMNRHQRACPSTCAGWPPCTAVRSENDSRATDEQQDADGDRQVLHLVRVAQLGDRPRTGRTGHPSRTARGTRRTPRSSARGRSRTGARRRPRLAALAAEHQQALVAGVGEGVDGLGQQAGRAGDQEADELGDGDARGWRRTPRGSPCGCRPRAPAQVGTGRRPTAESVWRAAFAWGLSTGRRAMGLVDGRVALVSGGGRGIGRGISERLAAEGATVAVNYRKDADAAADTVATIEAGRWRGQGLRGVGRRRRGRVRRWSRPCSPTSADVDLLVATPAIASRGNAVADTDPARGRPAGRHPRHQRRTTWPGSCCRRCAPGGAATS